jgi:hypothetical protein
MGRPFLLQWLIILTFFGCSGTQKRTPDFVLDDSAYIKLTVKNCSDTTPFFFRTYPMLPRGCVIQSIDIIHDTVCYFSHKATKPDFIELTLGKDFKTYVIPGDTLKIFADLNPQADDFNAVQVDGEPGEICKYYSARRESLGYWRIEESLTGFNNVLDPVEKAFKTNDSLFRVEMEFLNNYIRANKMPGWFYQIMKSDLEYNKVSMRPNIVMLRKFFFKETINNPEKLYTFDQVKFYNPKAKLSDYYYQFIDIYLTTKYEYDLDEKHGIERGLPIFERSIPEIKEILKGEILEYYLAYKISEEFLICKNIDEFNKVDSLCNTLQKLFTNTEIKQILKNRRDSKLDFFITQANTPFKFTEINPDIK